MAFRTEPLHYLLIGNGRLAHHLQHWFQHDPSISKSIHLHRWNRHQYQNKLSSFKDLNPIVLLAISDSSLVPFYEHVVAPTFKGKVIHFSGSTYDPRMITAHPLMSFNESLYSLETYKKIHWVLAGAPNIQTLFPFLQNSSTEIESGLLPLYHASCVLGGNFPVILWREMIHIFTKLGIPADSANIYLQTILDNFKNNPQTALTGPLIRNDVETILKNKQALLHSPFSEKELFEVYGSMEKLVAHSEAL